MSDPRLASFSFMTAGYTDAMGTAEYNQQLSERRAQTSTAYLVTKLGLNPVLLAARGNGESQLADVTNPENAINRRVQVLNIGETQ